MAKYKDLTGMKFGRLRVIKDIGRTKQGNVLWLCQCDCGNQVKVNSDCLIQGKTKSCRCFRKSNYLKTFVTHGLSKTRLYEIWWGMKKRCFYPKAKFYKDYGGRGVTIAHEWLDFATFYSWAMENGYSEGLTIERKDVNGNYEPGNCKWIPLTKQMRNTRSNHLITYQNQTRCMTEWAEIMNLKVETLFHRLKSGWDIEKALTQPLRRF